MSDRWDDLAASLEREDAELLRRATLARMAMPVRSCADCEDECDCVRCDPAAHAGWEARDE